MLQQVREQTVKMGKELRSSTPPLVDSCSKNKMKQIKLKKHGIMLTDFFLIRLTTLCDQNSHHKQDNLFPHSLMFQSDHS